MVPESNRKAGPFTGTGQTQFDFDFYMLSADDVAVIVADADEKETTLSKDAYTCTLNSDQNTTPGGRVTLKTALATGHKLAICSGVPYTQNLNLTMYGNFNPTSINKEEDRRVIQLQQIVEQMRRCLVVPITNDKTPQQVLTEVLETAATANSYAQQAQAIYDTVKGDVAEIKALKAEIDDLVLTFQTIEQLAAQAQANAHSTNDDKLTCQQALQQIQAIAAQTGFSTRTSPTVSESETFPLSNLTPTAYVKVGDLVLNSTNGDLFRITAVTATTATVGAKISNLRGPRGERGLQGSPGPAGERGEQGPMGQSPYASCFGQFEVNEEGVLQLEYVGLAPAEFSINDNGEVEANYANT